MARTVTSGIVPLIGLTLALAGCNGMDYWAPYEGGGEYEYEDGYEAAYLEAVDSQLYGGLGELETMTGTESYAEAYMDDYMTSITIYGEGPEWVAMSSIVLQNADREAIFVPGTRIYLGAPEGTASYAWGCSGVGAEPTLEYEDTGESSEVIVSEGEEEGTVIVAFSTTYSTEYGLQTMQGQVQITVPE